MLYAVANEWKKPSESVNNCKTRNMSGNKLVLNNLSLMKKQPQTSAFEFEKVVKPTLLGLKKLNVNKNNIFTISTNARLEQQDFKE